MLINKVEICGVNTSKLKVLKESEKIELLERIKKGDEKARNELISGNLRLVLSVVQKFTNRGENLDDLFQVGCIGLIKSIDNFDTSHNVRFSTYAVPMTIFSRNRRRKEPEMNRKQALMRVCEMLSTYEQTAEITEITAKLQEVMAEIPFTAWSEATIFDTIDQWILENGRVPNTRDLTKKGLPPVPVIKNRFGMTAREFLDAHYPKSQLLCQSQRYGHKSTEDWVRDFAVQYKAIDPDSAAMYNRNRRANSPTWATVARMCGLTRWEELLEYCGVERVRKVCEGGRTRVGTVLEVSRQSDVEEMLGRL